MRGSGGNLKRPANRWRWRGEAGSPHGPPHPGGRPTASRCRRPGTTFALGRPVGRNRGAVDDGRILRLLLAAIASHSAAASFPADGAADSAMAGMAAAISTASSGRASQVSLQREQRTVRPAAPKAGRIDGVRCCTMGANDVHGAHLHSDALPECYIATVNEPETITAAKPFCPVQCPNQRATRPMFRFGLPGSGQVRGFRPRLMSSGAELGSVRKCRFAVRARPGDFARPLRS